MERSAGWNIFQWTKQLCSIQMSVIFTIFFGLYYAFAWVMVIQNYVVILYEEQDQADSDIHMNTV